LIGQWSKLSYIVTCYGVSGAQQKRLRVQLRNCNLRRCKKKGVEKKLKVLEYSVAFHPWRAMTVAEA
jgi:hypothetical protein